VPLRACTRVAELGECAGGARAGGADAVCGGGCVCGDGISWSCGGGCACGVDITNSS